jgi:hypothetical protein
MLPPTKNHSGAPLGNINALKHGFYTRRIKKHDLSGVESTDVKGLAEEIALIRIFTRRLIESCDPEADAYELAGILRILCLASTTITRILKAHYLLSTINDNFSQELDEAIRQVQEEWAKNPPPPILAYPEIYYATHPHPSTDSSSTSSDPGDLPISTAPGHSPPEV